MRLYPVTPAATVPPRRAFQACARRLLAAAVLAAAVVAAGAAEPSAPADKTPSIDEATVKRLVDDALAQTSRYQLELRRRAGIAKATLTPGERAEVPLQLSMSGVPAGFDVYALVMAAQDECLVTERVSRQVAKSSSQLRSMSMKFGRFSWSGWGTVLGPARQPLVEIDHVRLREATIMLAGTPGAGALSTIGFGARAHPLNMAIGIESLSQGMLGLVDPDATPEKLEKIKQENQDFPLILNFAFLAASGGQPRETLGDLVLELEAPKSAYYYDRLVVWPVLLKRYANGLVVMRLEDARANRLALPARPPAGTKPAKCAEDAPPAAPAAAAPEPEPGRLSLAAAGQPVLRVGRETQVEFLADYTDLRPDTEIYVVLQAAEGQRVLGTGQGVDITSSSSSVRMKACNDLKLEAGALRIQPDPIVIAASPLVGGRLEAGKLATVTAGGKGTARGRIRFTPPPLNRYYDRIRATPVALTWSSDGRLCTTLSTEARPFVELPLEGR